MDTTTIVILAVAINLVVALAAWAVPRIGRRSRTEDDAIAAARLRLAASASAGVRPVQLAPSGAGRDSGWVPVEPEMSHAEIADADEAARAAEPWFPRETAVETPVAAAATTVDVAPVAPDVEPAAVDRDGGDLDPETGLAGPVAWARWLEEEQARVMRFHRAATVVLVELSGIDRLAERIGQEAAERLVPPIGLTMRRQARATDHLARLGPTRFAALLVETDEVRAINYIERVRSACDVWLEAGAVMLRLSVGWAEISVDRTAAVAVLDAERRLFAERERTRARLVRVDEAGPVELPALQQSGA